MFLRNKFDKPSNRIGPPGCNPLKNEDRMPVLKVVSGDTWVVSAALVAEDFGPASPKNSFVEFVVAENQFSPPLWTGKWFDGIFPDMHRAGLVHVNLPRNITKTFRRGSYMFSIRVGDRMRYSFSTQLEGYFLVEYMPTSEQHSIPYRDGTSDIFGGGCSVDDVSVSDGRTIRVLDEKTGLYHQVVAFRDEETGEVCLGVYQDGITEKEARLLGAVRTLRVLDKATGLYHRLVAFTADDGEVCLGVYQEGVTADEIPAADVGRPVRVRNEANGQFHRIEAVTVDGETNIGIVQSGTMK